MPDFWDLFGANFEEYLRPLWDSVFFWRSVTLVLFALLVLAWFLREKLNAWLRWDERREHDRQMFRQADEVLTEERLMAFLIQLSSHHSYTGGNLVRLGDLYSFLSSTGNAFFNRRIQKTAGKLEKALLDLNFFVADNFFIFPKSGTSNRLCLHPEWNVDRGDPTPEQKELYRNHGGELDSKIRTMLTTYEEYRRAVKSQLSV